MNKGFKMKLSNYNFLKKIDNKTVFFNTRTCAMAVVNDDFLSVVKDIKTGMVNLQSYDSELIHNMKRSGCIIEDDEDELQELLFSRNLQKYGRKSLGITIAPTLNCNFRCIYCFEKHDVRVMSEDVQEALVSLVHLQLNGMQKLNVMWFGGEPMLCKDIVFTLSKRLKSICDDMHISYNAGMVSNGSLFTDDDMVELKNANVRKIQITLDGPPEVHDMRRKTVSGKSSFKTIIHNINALLHNKIQVSLRINIDKNNIESIDNLLLFLKTNIDQTEDLLISFGKLSPFTEMCKDVETYCFDNTDFGLERLKLYQKVLNYGFKRCKMLAYPKPKFNVCGAEYANGFVVDHNGYLYKCWNQIGRIEESCGNVFQGINYKSPNYLNWIQWDPFKFEKCTGCKILPLCMGNCPYLGEVVLKEKRRPICDYLKYHFDEFLIQYYGMLCKKG